MKKNLTIKELKTFTDALIEKYTMLLPKENLLHFQQMVETQIKNLKDSQSENYAFHIMLSTMEYQNMLQNKFSITQTISSLIIFIAVYENLSLYQPT